MKSYYRVMLDKGGKRIRECLEGNFIAIGYLQPFDLTHKLPDEWRTFNREFIPKYLENHPGKGKVAAGLACGAVWTVSKGINIGDIVISPDGEGHYHVCAVTGDYFYQMDNINLPHRRTVHWFEQTINKTEMSEALRKSCGSSLPVSNISSYYEELDKLIGKYPTPQPSTSEDGVEDFAEFALEEHLQEFLIKNWAHTELGKKYEVYKVDGESVGREFPVGKERIDIFAISKDKKTLLVVELKKGRASDKVIGQTLGYMGYVQNELAEKGQSVKGVIIALEDDEKIRRALVMTPDIEFFRYQVSFKLVKA